MNRRNNKDLYQVIGIDKNASQQEINDLVLKTNPKDNPEVSKVLMVLTDSQKRIEYDKMGGKEEGNSEGEKEIAFRHSTFKTIYDYKHHYTNTEDHTPDGKLVSVIAKIDLDPNLWIPFQGGIEKIWGTYGQNGKQELEDFKNKMLAALDEAGERKKKTPLSPNKVPNEKDTGYCVYCKKKNSSETGNGDNTKSGKYEKYCSYACREKASADYCDNCQGRFSHILNSVLLLGEQWNTNTISSQHTDTERQKVCTISFVWTCSVIDRRY